MLNKFATGTPEPNRRRCLHAPPVIGRLDDETISKMRPVTGSVTTCRPHHAFTINTCNVDRTAGLATRRRALPFHIATSDTA